MANNLKLSYREVYVKVSEFLGLGSDPLTTDLAKVKAITLRGYRKFLMPIDLSQKPPKVHRWFFMHHTTTISTVSGQDTYELPADYTGLVIPFTHTTPITINPQQKTLAFIYELKSTATGSGYPTYFAMQTGGYDQLTGQRDKVIFWPPPNGVFVYYFTYIAIPSSPVEDDDVFVGDDFASECILECALAVADLQENDNVGVHAQEAETLIQRSIGDDKRQSLVGNLGSMGRKEVELRRTATISYENTQIVPTP